MRAIILIISIVLCALPALAGEYVITPRIIDVEPGDGIIDAGSPSNPYIIRDSYGREVGKIKSRIIDVYPGDGIMEPGTITNPWVLETQD